MKRPSSARPALAAAALALLTLSWALPAAARDSFVSDGAGLFSAGTVSQLNQRIGAFNAQTGKEVVVVTVASLGGASLTSAAQSTFSQQAVNGVLIFIAKDDRKDIVVPDAAGLRSGWFSASVTRQIREQMESQFRSGAFDAGITGAVDAVLNVYRAHLGSLRGGGSTAAGAGSGAGSSSLSMPSFGGFHLNMFWWIVIIVVGFLIVRAIFRSLSGPRYYGGGPMPGPGYGGGFGGPGYYGGGGGGFWSGLLGGLGGAWLGNELFGQHGGGNVIDQNAGGVNTGTGGDAGGWQSDAGQTGMGGASGGDWSGGGFGGDSGGGFGGGDFGGGGGDSGGGW